VFVRTDMPYANQLVQVGHACLEAGRRFAQPDYPCHLVLFAVASEDKLMRAVEFIQGQGIRMCTFYEVDFPRGYTAACSEPVSGRGRDLFRKFRLWR
jgi:hypothetical protein